MEQAGTAKPVFIAQARQRSARQPAPDSDAHAVSTDVRSEPAATENTVDSQTGSSRIINIIKLAIFLWLSWWFVHYFEIDRSLRQEPNTPRISIFWLYATLLSLLPFIFVYLYASVWRRRILGEPLDLENWQASSSSLVHMATIGLLFAWIFALIALFPGYGLKSIIIVAASTVFSVAIAGAIEGIF